MRHSVRGPLSVPVSLPHSLLSRTCGGVLPGGTRLSSSLPRAHSLCSRCPTQEGALPCGGPDPFLGPTSPFLSAEACSPNLSCCSVFGFLLTLPVWMLPESPAPQCLGFLVYEMGSLQSLLTSGHGDRTVVHYENAQLDPAAGPSLLAE